ncbi:MAG: hypothetical protein IPG71_01625 [bacterium]|nr:hypothetical protein [bacterium]
MRLLLFTLFLCLQMISASTPSAPYTYPVLSCLSCGDGLGENTVTLIHGQRELKFCCIECVSPYTKAPGTYISNLEAEIAAAQRNVYPLKTCVVSEHELGSMGEPVEYISGNTLFKFCCAACIEKFEQDKEQMLKKLDSARKK